MENEPQKSLEELEESEIGKRLLTAERVLRLISQGELPYIERVVSRAVFNARAIDKPDAFECSEGDDDLRQNLQSASTLSAYLAMNLTGIPQATLFYSRSLSLNESALLSSYFPKLLSMIYAAVGLSAESCAELDQEKLNKILRAGLPKPK
ncbi:MAG: hypothetical protein KDA65_06655 [Planctomycetaceae bacterium]|nr:hypothetical protein [Planctomycetaceae bacterium]